MTSVPQKPPWQHPGRFFLSTLTIYVFFVTLIRGLYKIFESYYVSGGLMQQQILFLMGTGGSGKSTLADLLAQAGYHAVNMSDLLTAWGKDNEGDDKAIKSAMTDMKPVPSEIVNRVLRHHLSNTPGQKRVITRFPYTIEQATYAVKELRGPYDKRFVYVDTPIPVCLGRLSKPREGRIDKDNPTKIAGRLERDHSIFQCIVSYLEVTARKRLQVVNGTLSPIEIFEQVCGKASMQVEA